MVAEGDSWFNHPLLKDIPEFLEDWTCVVHSNRPGKTLRESVESERYLSAFRPGQLAVPPSAIILSGGGNDLVDWEFTNGHSAVFQPSPRGTKAEDFLNLAAFDRFLAYYDSLLAKFARAVRRKHSEVAMLTHCYDYLRPSRFSGLPTLGPWIYPQLEAIEMPRALHNPSMRVLFDRWNRACARSCRAHGLTYIDLRGLTESDDDWADEIHPKSRIFEEMAARFYRKLPKK